MMWIWRSVSAGVAVIAASWLFSAAATEFTPHRALYTMSLVSAEHASGVSAVSGEMVVEWRSACAGWTFEYRSVIDVEFTEHAPLRLTTAATTWESRDGQDYRFNVRHLSNGEETERIEGVAIGSTRGKPGRVTFNQPKPREMTLPAGTVFPIAYSTAIMSGLEKTRKPAFISRMVFDGMDAKGLYEVTAAIGRVLPEGGGVRPDDGSMTGMRAWPVNLAYFSADGLKPEPDHEISMQLYANGVADDLVMQFDDFTLRASLGRIELLSVPTCP